MWTKGYDPGRDGAEAKKKGEVRGQSEVYAYKNVPFDSPFVCKKIFAPFVDFTAVFSSSAHLPYSQKNIMSFASIRLHSVC